MSVHLDRTRERWVVRWREAGQQRTRRFASETEAQAFDARVSPARMMTAAAEPAASAAGVYPYDRGALRPPGDVVHARCGGPDGGADRCRRRASRSV